MVAKILIEVDPQATVEKIYTYLGYIYIEPTSSDVAVLFLKSHFGSLSIYVNASELNIASVLDILDNGAEKVIITNDQLIQITEQNLVQDQARLVVVEDTKGAPSRSSTGGVFLQEENKLQDLVSTSKDLDVYVTPKVPSIESIKNILTAGGSVIVPASTVGKELQLEELLVTLLKSDRPDGLFTTLVSDERGISLGLVYSSTESIHESLKTGKGVYQSRKRGLWRKGETSGDVQELIRIGFDCDGDALLFTVKQKGDGFCHLKTATCFGNYAGFSRLEKTLISRQSSAPTGSYTSRLFNDSKLLQAKIMEEASELCEAHSKSEIASEAADLFYFALTRCIAAGVTLKDIESNLDLKSLKISRRKGDAKPQWADKVKVNGMAQTGSSTGFPSKETVREAASIPKSEDDPAGTQAGRIRMRRIVTANTDSSAVSEALQRPSQKSTEQIMSIVKPIIAKVQAHGDTAVLEYTHKFEKATSLTSPILNAPFPPELMLLPPETVKAIDISFDNIKKFHSAQKDVAPLQVETMPGVVCSRFSRPIESVGLYVPGGTAVLPSTALMLGVPAMVAGCRNIILASPPKADGTLTPEIIYVAHKVGAKSIVLAGGAQAVAAMAYGTQSITKVDKILGPGNQFVTAAKMLVSNDTSARVAIDMPAGPSEVLVIADKTANPAFVAADLLSQAEHGIDSQVVCIAVDLNDEAILSIENELDKQANALPRKDIVRGAIAHSVTLVVKDIEEAVRLSNEYAPEHLILQVDNAAALVDKIENAGSIFIGQWTPESVGDYSAGVNHSLRKSFHVSFTALLISLTATYGYAKQYSGVNLASFTKHITSSNLTAEGLQNVGEAVMQLAKVEELEAHRRAVSLRLEYIQKQRVAIS